jgi:hypothetical protein
VSRSCSIYSGLGQVDRARGDAAHISKPARPEVLMTAVTGLNVALPSTLIERA